MMRDSYRLALVIPAFNEAGNILPFVEEIRARRAVFGLCPHELILVDNGSLDGTLEEMTEARRDDRWIRLVSFCNNVGYGGGIRRGIAAVSGDITHVAWLPADRQYAVSAL